MLHLFLACTDAPAPELSKPDDEPRLAFPLLSTGVAVPLTEGGPPHRLPVPLPAPMTLWDAQGDTAVLLSERDPEQGLLLDLSTGETRPFTGRPVELSWEAGLLSTSPSALVPIQGGAAIAPVVATPSGPAQSSRLLIGETVYVVATDRNRQVWYGPWADPTTQTVSVTQPLPAVPHGLGRDSRGRPEAWTARGVPGTESDGECVRWRLDHPEPRCVAVRASEPTAHQVTLSDGWTAADVWGTPVQLYRDLQPIPWRLEPACDWTLTASLVDPPRVLAECQPSRDRPTRERRLWSPEGERAWTRLLPPGSRGMFHTQQLDGPILFEAIPETEPPLAVRWLDVATMEGWSSAPLVPLRGASQHPPALARSPNTGSVVLLDLAGGYWHPLVGAAEDCPLDVVELMRAGDWVLLSCRQQVSEDAFAFQQLYAQLINLETRRTWRIEAMVEALLDGGVLLVSDRQRDTAEGAVPFDALEVWDVHAESDTLSDR